MPRFTPPALCRTSPRLRWWSLSSALLLSIGAALLVLLPADKQAKAEHPRATLASSKPAAASAQTGGGTAALTKWEYATIPLPLGATKQTLDTWGEDGWELVQVVPNHPGSIGNQLVAYLQRPNFAR